MWLERVGSLELVLSRNGREDVLANLLVFLVALILFRPTGTASLLSLESAAGHLFLEEGLLLAVCHLVIGVAILVGVEARLLGADRLDDVAWVGRRGHRIRNNLLLLAWNGCLVVLFG